MAVAHLLKLSHAEASMMQRYDWADEVQYR